MVYSEIACAVSNVRSPIVKGHVLGAPFLDTLLLWWFTDLPGGERIPLAPVAPRRTRGQFTHQREY